MSKLADTVRRCFQGFQGNLNTEDFSPKISELKNANLIIDSMPNNMFQLLEQLHSGKETRIHSEDAQSLRAFIEYPPFSIRCISSLYELEPNLPLLAAETIVGVEKFVRAFADFVTLKEKENATPEELLAYQSKKSEAAAKLREKGFAAFELFVRFRDQIRSIEKEMNS